MRGIELRKIFHDDSDRDDFLERLSATLGESRTTCYAWALMPNHLHLLLKTGKTPIVLLLRRYRELLQKEAGRCRRRELRCWASRELGLTTTELARRLNLA